MSVREKSYWILRRERLMTSGLCIDCGKAPAKKSAKRCPPCAEKINLYDRNRTRLKRGEAAIKPSPNAPKDCPVTQNQVNYLVSLFPDGMNFGDIGYLIGVSRYRAQVICEGAVAKIYRECLRRGLDADAIIGKGFSMLAVAEKWS